MGSPSARLSLRIGSAVVSQYRASYADAAPGELFAIRGSAGYLEVSLNQGNAADVLGVRAGAPVIVAPPAGWKRPRVNRLADDVSVEGLHDFGPRGRGGQVVSFVSSANNSNQ